MKKNIISLGALSLLAVLLASCGGEGSDSIAPSGSAITTDDAAEVLRKSINAEAVKENISLKLTESKKFSIAYSNATVYDDESAGTDVTISGSLTGNPSSSELRVSNITSSDTAVVKGYAHIGGDFTYTEGSSDASSDGTEPSSSSTAYNSLDAYLYLADGKVCADMSDDEMNAALKEISAGIIDQYVESGKIPENSSNVVKGAISGYIDTYAKSYLTYDSSALPFYSTDQTDEIVDDYVEKMNEHPDNYKVYKDGDSYTLYMDITTELLAEESSSESSSSSTEETTDITLCQFALYFNESGFERIRYAVDATTTTVTRDDDASSTETSTITYNLVGAAEFGTDAPLECDASEYKEFQLPSLGL
jgi:hypothetical protein